MIPLVEAATRQFAGLVEERPAVLVAASAAITGAIAAVADGMSLPTAASAGVAAATVGLVTAVVRVLLQDLTALRHRVRELEGREDGWLAAAADERDAMRQRIAELERQLEGDGR